MHSFLSDNAAHSKAATKSLTEAESKQLFLSKQSFIYAGVYDLGLRANLGQHSRLRCSKVLFLSLQSGPFAAGERLGGSR